MTASNLADGLGLKNVEIEINYLASEFLSKNLFSENPLPILELKKALISQSLFLFFDHQSKSFAMNVQYFNIRI